ncbi:MAG: DNA-processing protein DprA [Armatimonadota bacterium]
MSEHERAAWLGLIWGAEIGPAGFHRLLQAYGSAVEALNVPQEDLIRQTHLKPHQAALVPRLAESIDLYVREAAELQSRAISVFLSTDAGYPAILHQLPHPPPVICVRGKILPIDDLALAIVGTRTPSRQGADLAGDMASAAVSDDFTIVSGLARGIDTAAHLGALGRQGRTIAVLGNGIAHVHPPENDELAERIEKQGAILSELPPHAEPTVPNLMARNRLISLLARGVIVVECGSTGGSLATAQAALQQQRKLYVVDWPELNERTVGNRQLLTLVAEPIRGVHDIRPICQKLHAARPVMEPPASKPQMSLF